MHTRGVSKRIAKDQETEEDRREEEAEIITDTEMEQQAGDKEEAREEPNWQDMMKFMAEQFRKQEETSKEQNKQTNEKNKQMSEKLENRIDSINENSEKLENKIDLSLIHI